MLHYLRWLWREAPRALRVEFLVTILVIELLALATILVLENPLSRTGSAADDAIMSSEF
jgi:hypothetical protein